MTATDVAKPATGWAWQPGVERWRVSGGRAELLQLGAGDSLTVIDVDGCQPVEISAWAPGGSPALAAIGLVAHGPARALAGATSIDHSLGARLARLGVDPERTVGVRPVGGQGTPGERWGAVAAYDLCCAIVAPGASMPVYRQDPPGEVLVEIRRAVRPDRPHVDPPPPLADPVLDLRVSRGTATAYTLTAGQYLQIVDVEGRQCSDLLAFAAAALGEGQEIGIDATATRTVIGQSYPSPGALANKYLGSNLRPLLEVVCDTVGRHDTLGLACTAKYYADLGYPGHPNCTDNFNTALSPYGVEPRAGWPAWNLFYNTALGPGGEVTFDEPWSRPGDFVLLRALDDLVVASSSCADDISPANGWWPTDIQVRVYRSDERFPRAKAHRVTPNSPPRLTRESGFQPRTALLTRRFDELHEFWVPGSYTGHGPVAEYWACRERVGMIDLSPLRKFEVVGPDAESLLQATLTRDVRRLPIGRVCYTALCNVTGGMIDDATCFRLGPDNFRLVGGEDYDGIWLREQAERMGLKVWVRDATEQISNLAVQGPASRDLLRPLVWTPPAQPTLDELTYYGFTIGRLGGERGVPVLVSRTGYSGELGYEVWCHPDEAVAVWDLLWEAGQPFGLLPFGLEALDLLRIEAGLPAGGHEFSDQIDPQEAGVGWIVARGKQEDFIGKAALQRRLAHPRQALVGLELEGNEVAGHGDGLLVGRDQVGVVTSGVRSPILHRSLALARLAVEFTVPGTQVEVGKLDGHQKRIAATVVRIPFYDPDKTRPRS